MSKRNRNVKDLNVENIKKPKIDTTLDDLWGDELDVNDIDDCLMLATHMYQQDHVVCAKQNNESTLPSYSLFEHTSKNLFTSTQQEASNATHSKQFFKEAEVVSACRFKKSESVDCSTNEFKIKQLEDKIATTSGEVTILRTKLRENRMHYEAEQSKINQEWIEKLEIKTKQIKGIESELQFKNLEIHNLAHKLKEITKLNATQRLILKESNISRTTNLEEPKRPCISEELKIECCWFDKIYPLKYALSTQIPTTSSYVMCVKDINPTLPCTNIQNDLMDENVKNSLFKLVHCSAYEIDLVHNQLYLNNLFTLSEKLLQNLLHFLKGFKEEAPVENTFTMNLEEIRSESLLLSTTQMGFNAKESLICLSETLSFSSYLKQTLLLAWKLKYLPTIAEIVKLISELKLARNFNYFLEAVIIFLQKVNQLMLYENLSLCDIMFYIGKQFIFCCTSWSSFICFLNFLSWATLQKNFLSYLCTDVEMDKQHFVINNNVLCYTQNTCVLQILFIVLENCLKENDLSIYNVALKFLSNSMKSNLTGFIYQEHRRFCFLKIIKLYINVMYKMTLLFKKVNNFDDIKLCEETLKLGIDTLYTFNLFSLVDKYVATYSRYKFVIKEFLNMREVLKLRDCKVEILEDLNKNDEVMNVPENAFENIILWKN